MWERALTQCHSWDPVYRTLQRPFLALRCLAVGTGTTQQGAVDVFCTKDSPWKRLAAASRREKKMSHMTVGQLTPDLVMTLKMRSTYCRRFSCNGVQVVTPTACVDRSLPRPPCWPLEQSDHTGDGAAVAAADALPLSTYRGASLAAAAVTGANTWSSGGVPLLHVTSLTGAGVKLPGTCLPDSENPVSFLQRHEKDLT